MLTNGPCQSPWTRPDFKPADKPVTLGDIRKHGVRGVLVYCANPACQRGSEIDASRWPDDVTLGELQPRMVCEACGHLGADVRPAWNLDGKPRR